MVVYDTSWYVFYLVSLEPQFAEHFVEQKSVGPSWAKTRKKMMKKDLLQLRS